MSEPIASATQATAAARKSKRRAPHKAGEFRHLLSNGQTREEILADLAGEGVLAAAYTTRNFSHAMFGETDLTQACKDLRKQIAATKKGDLSIADTLLVSQAVTLNAIFHECCRRGLVNMGQYPDAADRYMRLGLKAQSQCRTSLESLGAIKNPAVVFAKQANIAHTQQVNNEAAPPCARGEIESAQTELIGVDHGKSLDAGTASTASRGNPPLEAVAPEHRPAHGEGQESGKSQPLERRNAPRDESPGACTRRPE